MKTSVIVFLILLIGPCFAQQRIRIGDQNISVKRSSNFLGQHIIELSDSNYGRCNATGDSENGRPIIKEIRDSIPKLVNSIVPKLLFDQNNRNLGLMMVGICFDNNTNKINGFQIGLRLDYIPEDTLINNLANENFFKIRNMVQDLFQNVIMKTSDDESPHYSIQFTYKVDKR